VRRADNLAMSMCRVCRNYGSHDLLEPQRPGQACNGTGFLYCPKAAEMPSAVYYTLLVAYLLLNTACAHSEMFEMAGCVLSFSRAAFALLTYQLYLSAFSFCQY
jgi:hypothetical protein